MQAARQRKDRAIVGICLGCAWAAIGGLVLASDLNSGTSAFILMLSGWATAVYSVVLFTVRPPSTRRILGAIVLALVGVTHIGWLLLLVLASEKLVQISGFSGNSELGALFLLTALGYALTIGVCTASWIAAGIMVGAGAIAFGWTVSSIGLGNLEVALGLVTLHLGIVGALARDAFRVLRPGWPIGSCQACGYDLAGVRDPKCPECGMFALNKQI